MKNKKTFLAGAALLPLMMVTAVNSAGAFEHGSPVLPFPFGFLGQTWDRTIDLLDNGVETTFTVEDDALFTSLKPTLERIADKVNNNDTGSRLVDRNMEITDDSVVLTVTTDDEDRLDSLHKRAQKLIERDKIHDLWGSVTRTVSNLDNGVQLDFTTTNAAALTFLHDIDVASRSQGSITVAGTDVATGLQVFISTTDPTLVDDIQAGAAASAKLQLGWIGYLLHDDNNDDNEDHDTQDKDKGNKHEDRGNGRGWRLGTLKRGHH